MPLQAGTATRVINCEVGDDLCGQFHRRIATHVRDNLEANFLCLKSEDAPILLVGLDLVAVETADTRSITQAVEAATGIPARNVILTCTHTHDGPDTLGLVHDSPKNVAYIERLHGWLVDGAKEALAKLQPVKIGWGLGYAHVGYNRRLCWADGTHTMYGDASRPEFTGLEGPDDPRHAALFLVDEKGKLVGVVHNNCCHATAVSSATYASADFPGEARRILREALDPALPVLYLQGASGDTSPWTMLPTFAHYSDERRLREVGSAVAGETLRLLHEARPAYDATLRHAFEDVEIAVRLPGGKEIKAAEAIEALGPEKANRRDYEWNVQGVLRLYREFKDRPVDTLAVHVLRIGDLAIATNPCELYCQFGLDIKRRSPAKATMVSQLTDGFSGYCPTMYGIIGGGYSGAAIHWTRLEPAAGYRLVDTASRLLRQVWKA